MPGRRCFSGSAPTTNVPVRSGIFSAGPCMLCYLFFLCGGFKSMDLGRRRYRSGHQRPGVFLVATSSGPHVGACDSLHHCYYCYGYWGLHCPRRYQAPFDGTIPGNIRCCELLYLGSVCGPGSVFKDGIFQPPSWITPILYRAIFIGLFRRIYYLNFETTNIGRVQLRYTNLEEFVGEIYVQNSGIK